MKNIFTLFSLMTIFCFTGFSQNAPIDFEDDGIGADWTWTVFENDTNPPLEIVDNPDMSGINTSARVAQFTALETGNPWAGFESAHGPDDLGPFVLDASNSIIRVMVWKPVISNVGVKLVSENGWAQPEILIPNTVVNEWEELTFDFSDFPNPPSAEGPYDQIVIFGDFDMDGREQDNVIYIDNITFSESNGNGGEDPTEVTVTVDASREFVGFANVFETPENGGDFVFGSPWGVADIKSEIDADANTVTLFPNFNTYADNPDDPFWVDQATGLGNKVFEGNTFVEDASLVGNIVTFEGEVESYTLSTDYEVSVFIRVFNADFSASREVVAPITEAGEFSITFDDPGADDALVQYGFTVVGLNANPEDEEALGNVVIGAEDDNGGEDPTEVTVTVDASREFVGFANVFETPENGGDFVFGSPWGVADIKSEIDADANTVTLFPNFNTYADNPDDPFWVDQATGLGNKVFEGNTFIEDASLVGNIVTFEGEVESYTLSTDYEVSVFIRVFNADFSASREVVAPITEAGEFSITFDDPGADDALVQYGFTVIGLNANPEDEEALGNVVIGAEDDNGGEDPTEVTVTVDASREFVGFANVFETPENGGDFVFGSPWGVADIKSEINADANTVTLFPNFNTYADNPDDPFWVDQATGLGNKVFEGNTFIEDASLVGSIVTFEGVVQSYTLSSDYEVSVFIRVFNADFSASREVVAPITEAGEFSITFDDPGADDALVQYGFTVIGLNANPEDKEALGNVVIGAQDDNGGEDPTEVTVTVDASREFVGFANVFETPENGGGFVFGSPWGVADIKSEIDADANTVTLFPNFNTYADNPDDPFWVDQATGLGNKVFEGNTFIEDASLVGSIVTFEGVVQSYTLSSDYEVSVFIRVFNADFSASREVVAPITEAGEFSITFDDPGADDALVQYGFTVIGLNANPEDEEALGNVVIGAEDDNGGEDPTEVTVTVDASREFVGFANVFETPENGGGFVFGSPWGVADIKSEIDADANTVTLFPNFNTYADNPDDPFWVDQATGLGNKVFEGNTFIEDASLVGNIVTFEGVVQSYTLSSDYEVSVFIRVFNADFSAFKEVVAPLTGTGEFSITFDDPGADDALVQYGFTVIGLNANPEDEEALGNVVIGDEPTSTIVLEETSIRIFPNPTSGLLTIESESSISRITAFNNVGQMVLNINSPSNTIDLSQLPGGLYFLQIESEAELTVKRLMVK